MQHRITNKIIETETADFGFDEIGGIGDVLLYYMKKHANKIAQIMLSTGETQTFQTLLKKSIRAAVTLKQKGIRKDDTVLVCSERDFNSIVPIIAATFLGAIPCHVNATVSLEETRQILETTKPQIVFTSKKLLDSIKTIRKTLNAEMEVISFDEGTEFTAFKDFLTTQVDENVFQAIGERDFKRTCELVYKNSDISTFVCKNHYYYFHSFYLSVVQEEIKNNSENIGSFINYNTSFGGYLEDMFISVVRGQSMLIYDTFSVENFWKYLSEYQISDIVLESNQIKDMVKHKSSENAVNFNPKRIFVNGENLLTEDIVTFQDSFPKTELILLQSNMDTGVMIAFEMNKKNREILENNPGIIGVPVPGLRYRVVNLNTERNNGPREAGELRVKGDSITKTNVIPTSSNYFDIHGWFKTGKMVTYDVNGFFYTVEEGFENSDLLTNQKYKNPTYTINSNNVISNPFNHPVDEKGLGHLFFTCMKKYSSNVAQYILETNEKDTYGELLQRCVRVALNLQQYDLKNDEVIMVCTRPHKDACVPLIAATFLGVQVTYLDLALAVLDTKHLINEIRPAIIIMCTDSTDLIEASIPSTGKAPSIIVFGKSDTYKSFDDLLQPHKNESSFSPKTVNSLEDSALIVFSSGTTGFPKGIVLNNYTVMCQAFNCSDFGAGPISLSYTSLYWVSGIIFLWTATLNGTPRLICPRYDSTEIWHLLEKYRVGCLFLSPSAVIEMLKEGRPEGADTSSLSCLLTGGDKSSETTIKKIRENFPGTLILQGYGQSEVAGPITQFRCYNSYQFSLLHNKPSSVGTVVRGFSVRVVNPDNEKPCGPFEEGELRVKSRILMNGYFNRDSSEAFDADGWLRTGDILYFDNDLAFYYVDRIKSMMKYKSWPVAPAVVENIIMEHPGVDQTVVLGLPHPEDGAHPLALVIPSNEYKKKITPQEIQKFVEERVPDRMKLRGGVKIIDRVPQTTTGKVNRRELKNMILAGKL